MVYTASLCHADDLHLVNNLLLFCMNAPFFEKSFSSAYSFVTTIFVATLSAMTASHLTPHDEMQYLMYTSTTFAIVPFAMNLMKLIMSCRTSELRREKWLTYSIFVIPFHILSSIFVKRMNTQYDYTSKVILLLVALPFGWFHKMQFSCLEMLAYMLAGAWIFCLLVFQDRTILFVDDLPATILV